MLRGLGPGRVKPGTEVRSYSRCSNSPEDVGRRVTGLRDLFKCPLLPSYGKWVGVCKWKIRLRDAEWSGLKMVVVWTSVALVEMERSEQWRVCYGGRAAGFADALGGRKRKECEQKSIDFESWTAG